NPDSAQAARALSIALDNLGDFLMTRGAPKDADQALRCREGSLEIRRRLYEKNPESAQAARDLFYGLNRMMLVYNQVGKKGKAMKLGAIFGPLLIDIEERGFDFDNKMKKDLASFKARGWRIAIIAGSLGLMLLTGIGYAIWRIL
ncbi:hypothetical protein, partial [Desulfovibrio desulfuricans]|uniref:hypothetical protein n=1 Tax=Desulfovibrio desulfuricans TaxID=876 RepID=UPI0035AF95AF